jgi:succinate-semialdehyde dehydrogenase / glutarate-semialdehyde dehydrogenase
MIPVSNPRTGQHDYTIVPPTKAELALLCTDMRKAQPLWQSIGIAERINIMQKFKAVVEEKLPRLIDALCIDTGRYYETVLEANLVATSIDRLCTTANELFKPNQKTPTNIPFIHKTQDLIPYQLVGVISPWNFPLLLSLIDTLPALLCGCAVVVKPSEVTPRFIKVINQCIQAVPTLKDVFKYIEGDGETGAALVEQVDLVCFTGSTATGKKVYQLAAQKMIPVFLELGGKDPVIVNEGANLDLATSAILWGSTVNAGQSCLSVERVYVHKNVYANFLDLLVAKAKNIKLATPLMKDGQLGPIMFSKQVAIINEQLAGAVANGATILCGEKQCINISGGYYLPPTVIANVNHSMMLMQEETFGPIIPVMPFDTIEEGLQLANDSKYGLSGAVFAATNEEAQEIAQHLVGGAIGINDCALTSVVHDGEKQSFKLSGIGGTRMGANAFKRFVKQKVFLSKENADKDPWWF